jgi:hypothetical protein
VEALAGDFDISASSRYIPGFSRMSKDFWLMWNSTLCYHQDALLNEMDNSIRKNPPKSLFFDGLKRKYYVFNAPLTEQNTFLGDSKILEIIV